MIYLYVAFGVLLFLAGNSLLSHLGAGSVPNTLRPLTNAWAKAGVDTKWINVGLWLLFALIAVAMLLFVGFYLYTSAVDLGRGFK
jgi:hypothetical protein